MTSFIPAMPTLADMAANDTINYKGQAYVIQSVGTYTDDGGGRGHRTVTISAGTFTVHTSDCVCSDYSIDSDGNQTARWSQSAAA